jgi:hypothetical protein
VFERAKKFHALFREATVTKLEDISSTKYSYRVKLTREAQQPLLVKTSGADELSLYMRRRTLLVCDGEQFVMYRLACGV